MIIQRASVIGLGKLGACMAACFAGKGFDTVGVDLSLASVEAVNKGLPPVEETDLAEWIQKGRTKLKATLEYREAVLETDATFVIVPTPSNKEGGFSLRFLLPAFEAIGRALKEKSGYHLVVLTSTVLPGSTENALLPILEKFSQKKSGKDFGLCYSPEFIALGSVIRDFLNPDFVLIGESDEKAGEMLGDFYKKVCDNDPPLARMNLVNAELTKVSVNSFMTMKISFANMLAALCENLPGGDVRDVTRALGLFGGVGQKSLKGGLGYGGPCLPRDNVALAFLANRLGLEIPTLTAVDQFNRLQVERILNIVRRHAPAGGRVAVLGLAYKPATWVVEESQGLELARRLAGEGFQVTGFDPKAIEPSKKILGNKIGYTPSLEEAVADADAVILTTPDPVFKTIEWKNGGKKPVVIDCWLSLFDQLKDNPNVSYIPAGVGSEPSPKLKTITESLL